MKKIVKIFAVLTLFNIAFSSCKQDQYDIAKQNLVATHSADGPIAQAEAKFGTLEKRDVTFTDETGKSSFKMRFAAKSQKIIEAYLEENKYEFFTITASEKNEKYSKVVPRDEDKEAKSFDLLAETNQNDVFTELISKKIEKGIVGYGVEISYKKINWQGKMQKY
jgi:SPX domain protein involved in polyphosphate accumulation